MGVVKDSSVPRSTKTGEAGSEACLSPADLWQPATGCLFAFQALVKGRREDGGSQPRQELSLAGSTGGSPSQTAE